MCSAIKLGACVQKSNTKSIIDMERDIHCNIESYISYGGLSVLLTAKNNRLSFMSGLYH